MTETDIDKVVANIDAVRSADRRFLVAIAGAPASGKSTLAANVVKAIADRDGADAAALVPMDGYHLDNADLDARGLRAVKGAPQTFDVTAFVALIRRIRSDVGPIRYPLFDRVLDATVPDAGALAANTPVVVVEGNYLLLQDPVWSDLAALFDLTVFLSVPMAELRARLVDRWLTHGLSQAEAEARTEGNDIVNARYVIAHSAPAHLTLGSGVGEAVQEGAGTTWRV